VLFTIENTKYLYKIVNMGMIVCKSCFETKIQGWKKPFDENAGDPEQIGEYNEYVQHYSIYQVADIASKLQNGEMIEILCSICKRTHVAKDANGNIKVRFAGDPIGQWTDHV
jgi:hypothetical protein